MAHDVFISYSTKDKPVADAICSNLEIAGVRCWIAPRDIYPGADWPRAIANAISQSSSMVLIFSANANSSEQISRELSVAADCSLIIIPFKIDDAKPEPGKQYYLARTHWLDAMNPPTQNQINSLVERVKSIIPEAGTGDRGNRLAPMPETKAIPRKAEPQVGALKQPGGAVRKAAISRRALIATGSIALGLAALAALFKPLSAFPAQRFATTTSTFFPTTTPLVTPSATVAPTLGPRPTPKATADARILNPANQHLYLFVDDEMSWNVATAYCASRSGHLATIQDDAESTFVFNLAGRDSWLGASRDAYGGAWQWVTGEPWKFIKWGHGSFKSYQVYALLAGTGWAPPANTVWRADGPGAKHPYVCEWEPN